MFTNGEQHGSVYTLFNKIMAYSYTQISADGSTNTFAVPFSYISKSHVAVTVDGVATTFTWPTTATVTLTDTAASLTGKTVEIRRTTPRTTRLVDFQDAANVTEAMLDTSALQQFYIAQEVFDDNAAKLTLVADGSYDALTHKIKNLADGTADQDAVTFVQLTNAALSPVTPNASSIAFTPVGTVAATDVQTAIAEVSAEDAAADALAVHLAGAETISGDKSLSGHTAFTGTTNLVFGDCVLQYTSATLLTLSRKGGRHLTIDGKAQVIPSGGVTLANTGLTAATVYYIYAYMDSGVMTLEASETGHSVDTTSGVEIKTGDSTRTLVGAVYTDAGTPGTFSDWASARYTRSWYKDRGIVGRATFTADRSTSSGTVVELNTEIRCNFLAWAGERLAISAVGSHYMSAAYTNNLQAVTAVGLDGATALAGFTVGTNHQTDYGGTLARYASHALSGVHDDATLTETLHYVTLLGYVTGGTGVWLSASIGKTYLTVATLPR